MFRKGILALAVALLAALILPLAPALGQTRAQWSTDVAVYFPLRVGNEWVYQRTGLSETTEWRAAVTDRVTAPNGRSYFVLAGYFFGPARQVRSNLQSTVREFNPEGSDSLWYLLGAEPGTSWVLRLTPLPILSPIRDCVDGSKLTLVSRREVVRVPAGEFRDVVRVDFESPCVDAGIVSEWFAPGVGLIRRVENSFAGPVVSELLRAEVGDQTLPRLPYSATLALDRPAYVNNLMPIVGPDSIPTVHAQFILRNRTRIPVELTFGGCKSVSVVVTDQRGEAVLRARGDDGGCCLCENLLRFTLVDDTLMLSVRFKLQSAEGKPLPDGTYSVTATLNALGLAMPPSATATIRVSSIY